MHVDAQGWSRGTRLSSLVELVPAVGQFRLEGCLLVHDGVPMASAGDQPCVVQRGGYSDTVLGQRGAAGQVWGWTPVRQVIPAGRPWSGQAGARAFRSAGRASCRSSAIPLAG
jgi:hypothetical protein